MAPEHPLLGVLVPEGPWPEGTKPAWTGGEAGPQAAVTAYQRSASRKSEVERQSEGKDKTGVFTGVWATNPVTGQRIPVFVADYVLMGYGTGAIMAVPGQDERDWDFATRFDLPIVRTVQPSEGHPDDQAFTGEGPAINSANDEISLDGLPVGRGQGDHHRVAVRQGTRREHRDLQAAGLALQPSALLGRAVPDRLRRGRQRPRHPDSMLPVELPDVPDYSPKTFDPEDDSSSPEPPLGRVADWVNVELDLGDGRGVRTYRRETNTMPNWAGSCWYYLRYLDPANQDAFVDPENELYWMGPQESPVEGAPEGVTDPGGVDLYIGGVEHAVLHLLYARFWHKVLFDLGHVSSEEPFRKYFSQGYIQAAAYRDDRGQPVEASEVEVVDAPGRRADVHLARTAGDARVRQDRQVAQERRQSRRDVRAVRRRHPARLRDVDGPPGAQQALGDAGGRRGAAVPAATVAQRRRRGER